MSSEVLATVGIGRQELTLALAELKTESLPTPVGGPGAAWERQKDGSHQPRGMAVAGSWLCLGLTWGSLLQKDQFGMYALYSKNKPKSDSLLASHGNTFFKVNAAACTRGSSGRWGHCSVQTSPAFLFEVCSALPLPARLSAHVGRDAMSALGRSPAPGSIDPVPCRVP